MQKGKKARDTVSKEERLAFKEFLKQLEEEDDEQIRNFSISSDIVITAWLLFVSRRLNESSRTLESLTRALFALTFVLCILTPALLAKDLWWGKVPF
ncbi:MAG: hypothetical protein Q7T26_10810 [Dehalococcoidia bacterium]|nr:hypothetical protein [Dehalococcoidia bacterium]